MINLFLIILIFISGWMVQRGGFCLVAASEALLVKQPNKILLILIVSLFSGAVLMLFKAPNLYSIFDGKLWLLLVGACIFGFGATLNNGCFFGTLTQLCNGNGYMLFSLLGITIASILIPPFAIIEISNTTAYPSVPFYLFLLILISMVWWFSHHEPKIRQFLWLLIPGITFGIINSSTSGWSLSQLILNIWYFFHQKNNFGSMQVIEFIAFFLGMFFYHFKNRSFHLKQLHWSPIIKHFMAGMIMVFGARMMGGGNDHLLFSKLPSLMPEILLLFAVMLLSIILTLLMIEKIKIRFN